MTTGIIGKKIGMTRYFLASGEAVPVTVVEAGSCVVTEVRSLARDGYEAVRIGYGVTRAKTLAKPQRIEAEKKNQPALKYQQEFRGMVGELGATVSVSIFAEGDKVATRSQTIGRGYQGVIKRHGFAGGPATHGASKFHRGPGSHGQRMTPGEVFKGMKQPGHMGCVMRTTRNLTVVKIDADNQLLYIRGAVSGANGAIIRITKVG